MLLVAGSRSGSYKTIAPIGAGGMGEVYRARDSTLKRDVAIQVLPDFWSRDVERLHRFELEARATAALNHPNIVSIFHVGQHVERRQATDGTRLYFDEGATGAYRIAQVQ